MELFALWLNVIAHKIYYYEYVRSIFELSWKTKRCRDDNYVLGMVQSFALHAGYKKEVDDYYKTNKKAIHIDFHRCKFQSLQIEIERANITVRGMFPKPISFSKKSPQTCQKPM